MRAEQRVLLGFSAVGLVMAAGWGWVVACWAGAVLLIGGHEAGHALAARRLGYTVPRVVVGFGPTIVRFPVGVTGVRICAFPVFGWTELDLVDDPATRPRHTAAVYLAGPVASGALAFALILGALAWPGSERVAFGRSVRVASGVTLDAVGAVWAAPFHLAAGAFDRVLGSGSEDDVPSARREHPDAAPGDDPEVVSVVGIAAEVSRHGDEIGARGAALLVGAVSAGIAGFNLLPVWGLDGYGVLQAGARAVRKRHRGIGRTADRALTAVGVVMALLVFGLLVVTVGRDLAALV